MRANTGTHLTVEQLQRAAPAAFATSPASDVSDRYAYIPTYEILARVAKETGFLPVAATQRLAKGTDPRYATHAIRLRRPEHLGLADRRADMIGVPEIHLINSHDRGSSLSLSAAAYRLICSNGMVAPVEIGTGINVRHVGQDMTGLVSDGCISVVAQAVLFVSRMNEWAQIQMPQDARSAMASQAMASGGMDAGNFSAERMLRPVRYLDRGTDLNTTFNVLQENCIKGGVQGFNSETRRRVAVRQVAVRLVHGALITRSILVRYPRFMVRCLGTPESRLIRA